MTSYEVVVTYRTRAGKTKSDLNKIRQERLLEKGRCVTCGKPNPRKGKRECASCARKATKRVQQLKKQYISEGRCWRCGEEAVVRTSAVHGNELNPLCRDCWFRTVANSNLKAMKRWTELRDLLAHQNNRCAYTGELLITGQNMSLDHKVPRSRGGGDELSNLQWVTWRVNLMKSDMTHEEFLSMCWKIGMRFGVSPLA
jgi:5-methylcytosine-specific restriction endonuclease McrA